MAMIGAEERAAMRGLLRSMEQSESAVTLSAAWESAYWAAPRHAFLPDTVWTADDLARCSRTDDPGAWLRLAYADAPVVTQLNDGERAEDGERWPSCSASAPTIVFRMLDLMDVGEGHRVLEIGTGTGWNTGLLAHRVGANLVTTVEVDPVLSARAARSLKAIGLEPNIICGDGAFGAWAYHPFDRVVATCAVRSVPLTWIDQSRPGGVVLTPWDSPWFCFGLLRLVVDDDGNASGPFFPYSAFMLMRQQRTTLRIYRDVVRDDHVPAESHTEVHPQWLAGGSWDAMFALGLLLPKVWHTWQDDPNVDGVTSRLWLATTDASSWAAVDLDGTHEDRFTVWQHGPLNLWDMAEAAWLWWCNAGSPGPERFGMSVNADGTHTPWLDDPDHPVPRW